MFLQSVWIYFPAFDRWHIDFGAVAAFWASGVSVTQTSADVRSRSREQLVSVQAAGVSRSSFAARFKEILGQTPLEYVTAWRMQRAMQLVEQHDKKLIDVARSVGYESDAAFSKAFKRVVGANTGESIKRGLDGEVRSML